MNVGTPTKPIIVDDDMDIVESPEFNDFSVSDKVLHAPHRHSNKSKHAPTTTTSAPGHQHPAKGSKKRVRPVSSGHRRSELQEEVRFLLEESLDDESMDLDEDRNSVEPSYASEYASDMLGGSMREAQSSQKQADNSTRPREGGRVAFEKYEGKKRACCSAEAMSVEPAALYGEVVL
jgi:hypothetical protein